MNESLEATLNEALQKAMSVAEQGGQFALEMAPELLNQFMLWRTGHHSFFIFLGLVFMVYMYVVFRINWKADEWGGYDERAFSRSLTGGIVGALGIAIFLTNIYYLIFIVIAPKIYLIDYVLN